MREPQWETVKRCSPVSYKERKPIPSSRSQAARTNRKREGGKAAKAWLKEHMHRPVAETMQTIASILRGHCNYYGVNGNFHAIQSFWKYMKYSTYRVLNRRHQKRSMKYNKFLRIWNYYVKEPHLTTDIWGWQPKIA